MILHKLHCRDPLGRVAKSRLAVIVVMVYLLIISPFALSLSSCGLVVDPIDKIATDNTRFANTLAHNRQNQVANAYMFPPGTKIKTYHPKYPKE